MEPLSTQARYPLDAAVDASLRRPNQPSWGMGQVGLAVLGALAAYLVLGTLALAAHLSDEIATVIAYLGLGAVIAACCQPAARQAGGWLAGVGWSLPRVTEIPTIALWSVIAFAARTATSLLLVNLIPSLRHQNLSNVEASNHSTSTIVILAVVTVAMAPVVEELFFRGLTLRAGMRRFGFWPAAIGSSLLFGAAHSYELGSVVSGLYLAIAMAVFGLVQCLLVRRTGRIGPAIGVHATNNALALIIAVTTGAL